MQSFTMKTTDPPPTPFTVSKARFESFSDGVFAIAITLLILEVRLPADASARSSSWEQARALLSIWPQYLVYAASFATIGIMWINHHALFKEARRITHGCTLANLLLLGLISFLPFTTEVLGHFGLTPTAVVYYGLTMVAIALAYNLVHQQVYAAHGRPRPVTLWNVVGLSAYPFATIIGYFVPLLGIIVIALLAIFYMMPNNIGAVALPPAEPSDGSYSP
jgi:uncharacterized membrane protein